MVEGAEMIAYSIDRYAIVEDLYFRPYATIGTRLRDRLTNLYTSILKYLIRAKRYFEKNTGVRMLKAVVVSKADFEPLLKSIATAQKEVDEFAKLVDAERSRDLAFDVQNLTLEQAL